MSSFEVAEPIINSPYKPPAGYWYIREGRSPEKREGRRPSIVFPPRDQKILWNELPGIIKKSKLYPAGFELELVNTLRERVRQWRESGWSGASRTTVELLRYWQREGRRQNLFFAQLEAAETVIFLKEAREDFKQGICVPRDIAYSSCSESHHTGFERLACKMATGSGKTTVMAMLAAWSILNKALNRNDSRFSDVILIVCPNVTIRSRLRELDPLLDEGSLYRSRDLVPENLMPQLRQGKVLVTNWHVFQPQTPQTGGVSAKVIRSGKPVKTTEIIFIGDKCARVRGMKYLTIEEFRRQQAAGIFETEEEYCDSDGRLAKAKITSTRYVESDTALADRVLKSEFKGKQNILIMNDEAHHAYRIVKENDESEDEIFGEDEEAERFYTEATVWIDGLDKINRIRGINFCIDLSATPFFLGRVGQETNKPFPWVVSDFGLIEAIESGLVKIPQLAIRDTTGADIPGYFNLWKWIMEKLTPKEKGGKKGTVKPEAVLKYVHTPIAMLGSLWQEKLNENTDEPPVFIIVCKNTAIAKVLYQWIAEDIKPLEIPSCKIEGFRNQDGQIKTIRVDSKVADESDTGESKSDESRWMRFVLDTVGKPAWLADKQGRPIYPEGFEELAQKIGRSLTPPGKDIRCIVSVSMLTEGWDCNTVEYIIGLRPFMSQLLCEQVVGRGLRRSLYEINAETGLFTEEVAKVLGVPFEVIPFKENKGIKPQPQKLYHIHALPEKSNLEICFPRVEGYTQAIRNRIAVNWDDLAALEIKPGIIPPEVEMKGLNINKQGRPSLSGPGRLDEANLNAFRQNRRIQELVFDMAKEFTRIYSGQGNTNIPPHVLFPQLVRIIRRFIDEKVIATPPADKKDLFLAPWYGWMIERIREAIQPDTESGESAELPIYEANRGPGSTADVDYWTRKKPQEIIKSHLNYIVPDTRRWEQSAAYYIDTNKNAVSFVKNAGLGFAIPYFHNDQAHDYLPDFIIRLKAESSVYLILEVKGFDPTEQIKAQAAKRWINAVNADGRYGKWLYAIARKPEEVNDRIKEAMLMLPH
ncbi:MAG: type III restriction endonuclease subunit R [Desulfobacteraceae bacterium IS3]|nr:MAG: type III restriction endonuclease subunit R [Desulfobacteraceae bacterium IS3]